MAVASVFLVFFAIYSWANAQVGDPCYMQITRLEGICKFSYDCPEAEKAAQDGIAPTLCGDQFLQTPIVCCHSNYIPKPSDNIYINDEDIQKENYENRPGNYFERPQNNYERPFESNFNMPHNNYERPQNYNERPIINNNYNERPINNNNYHERPFNNNNNYNERPTNNNNYHERPFNNNNNYNERPFNHNTEKPFNTDSIIFGDTYDGGKRKCEKKCEEYTKDLQEVVGAIPLVTNTEVVTVKTEKCVHNGVPLIVGGEPAIEGEFPFMAALGFFVDTGIDWRCGATLISEVYVITAAHCTFSRDAGDPRIVRLGEIDLTRESGGRTHKDYAISKIIPHPNYSFPFKYDDIALIKLDRKVHFSNYIRPACLNTKTVINRVQSTATGFGKTEFAASENHNKLLKVALNIYDNSRCAYSFRNDKRTLPKGIVNTMLCAGEIKGGKDTCQGDSGGPLVISETNNHCKFYLIGITSFGKACGESNTAGVYTRVSEYLDWIERIVW